MLVALITTVGCAQHKWDEVPVYYTPIYSIMPYDQAIYEFKVYYEVGHLSVWDDYAMINRYSFIEDFVDNSGARGVDEFFVDFSFTELVTTTSSVDTGDVDENGDAIMEDVTTTTKNYYTVVETDDNHIYNYSTVTITSETGAVTTYTKASITPETGWVDMEYAL